MNWRHIRRLFAPSRTISRYMVRMQLTRFLGILIGLVAILQLLDLLAQSDAITDAGGGSGAMLRYATLRLPELISQFIPFAALLATLLTLATLNQSSEITAMKAMGMSAHRILFPLGLASFAIAATHFTFNELVVVKSTAELDWWRTNDYTADLPEKSSLAGRVWLKDGDKYVHVENISRLKGGIVLDDISLYEKRGVSGLDSLARADFAVQQEGRWTLHNVRVFDTKSHGLTVYDTEDWPLSIGNERLRVLNINAKHQSVWKLWSAIQVMKAEGLPAARPMASLLQKFAGPASSILMPLLGAISAFGVARRGNLLLRVIAGMALGFSYFVADNFMLAMGEFGVAPPLLAAWSPFLLFLMLGYLLLFATEEGRLKRPAPAAREKASREP